MITRVGPEYPDPLVHGHQPALATSQHLWVIWAPQVPVLAHFDTERALANAITGRFHSSRVRIDAHCNGDGHTTTRNVGGTANLHQLVHLLSKRHQTARYRDVSATMAPICASQ